MSSLNSLVATLMLFPLRMEFLKLAKDCLMFANVPDKFSAAFSPTPRLSIDL